MDDHSKSDLQELLAEDFRSRLTIVQYPHVHRPI
jgi:hypothetical protein